MAVRHREQPPPVRREHGAWLEICPGRDDIAGSGDRDRREVPHGGRWFNWHATILTYRPTRETRGYHATIVDRIGREQHMLPP
ncbi:hypothetical protein GCM10009789_15530 [Kribbella sancticallisti]|uniref:Uncharacterized protein n=1 Tax=Kribbella sancticallisti TaxID=460087 RepID=A0ABP4NNT2_9ACTN